MRRRKLIGAIFAYAALLALLVLFLFPLLWILGLSFKTRMQVFASPPLFLWTPTIDNYVAVLKTGDFQHAFMNSLLISAEAVLLSISIGVPAAYTFARFHFAARGMLFMSLLVMRMLPPIAVLVPMYVLFAKIEIGRAHV